MTKKEILVELEIIEAELDDAIIQMPEYNANSDARVSIDSALDSLYSLKDTLENSKLTIEEK